MNQNKELDYGLLLFTETYSVIVLYSRDHKGVGVAHKIASAKNQPQFSQTTIRQYWLGLNKRDQPEMLHSIMNQELLKKYLCNPLILKEANAPCVPVILI